MGLKSMTGFASVTGQSEGVEFAWEARSVNARGLDLRIRLPEGLEGLEPLARTEAPKHFKRGTVNVSLRVNRGDTIGAATLNPDTLKAMVAAVNEVRDAAKAGGLELAPTTAGEILSLRGVLDTGRRLEDSKEVETGIGAKLPELFASLDAARSNEGEALRAVLNSQITRVAELVAAARESDTARSAKTGQVLRDRVQALLETTTADEARLAQELAMLAVKADITEEMDRLEAHIASAYALLDEDGPVGRKLDFLMQEFNREANTLCSKSGDAALTAAGLELKVVIDQMREQVQNVE
jgi:uncharacterized protein (TIGR00255 family)